MGLPRKNRGEHSNSSADCIKTLLLIINTRNPVNSSFIKLAFPVRIGEYWCNSIFSKFKDNINLPKKNSPNIFLQYTELTLNYRQFKDILLGCTE